MRKLAAAPAPAASPLAPLRGLVGQVRRWLVLRGKRREIAAAERRAADSAAQLAAERAQIAADLAASKQSVPHLAARHSTVTGAPAVTPTGTPTPAKTAGSKPVATGAAPAPAASGGPAGAGAPGTAPNRVSVTRKVAAEQRRLTLRDERITARRRLADVYGQWDALLAGTGAHPPARLPEPRGDRAGRAPRAALRQPLAGAPARARPHRPTPARDAPQRGRGRAADSRRGAHRAGRRRGAGAARHHGGTRRRRPHGGAQGFHRVLRRLVRADGQERHPPRRLGRDQRRER